LENIIRSTHTFAAVDAASKHSTGSRNSALHAVLEKPARRIIKFQSN